MKSVGRAQRVSVFLLIVVLSLGSPDQAGGASIGLFSASDCTSCNLVVGPGETSTFYVRALTEGSTEWGFTGAGLRIDGLPSGWGAFATPNPEAVISVGDLFGPDGATIAFSAHVPGTCIDLYTVSITATTPIANGRLDVEGVRSVWQPEVCPFFVPGCTPCDFVVCVEGGTILINSAKECNISIESTNWSSVKYLYR